MRSFRRAGLIVLLAGCVGAIGCGRLAGLLKSATGDGNPTPADEQECRSFAVELETAVGMNDSKGTADLFHLEDVFYSSVSDFEGPPEYHAGLRKSCRDQAATHPFVPLLLADVKRGGQLHLLHVHEVDGRQRAMFRFIGSDGTVDYVDVLPVRHGDGRIRMADMYFPATGELASQTMRRVALKVGAEENQGPPGHAVSTDRIWLSHLSKLEAMHKSMVAGHSAEAIPIYNALPATMRNDKSVFLKYVQAARWTGPNEYLPALEGYRRQFPNDAALEFQNMDYFRLTRQHEANLRAITVVEQAVGGDPYLNCLRAMTFVRAWRYPEARVAAEKAVAEEPKLKHAYLSRLRVALQEANHADTLTWLMKMVEATGNEVEDLRADPDYAVFVRSPQFRDWLTWQATRKSG